MSSNQSPALPTPPINLHKPHDEGVGSKQVWESIKAEYQGSSMSVRSLAAKYSINRNKINKKRKDDNWTKYVPGSSCAKKQTALTTKDKMMLGPISTRKIEEVKKELGDHYSPVDEPLIVVFAKNYERYIELEYALADEGVVLESEKTGGKYQNPTFTALQAVQKTLLTYANQLGLSMTSRKLLGIKLGESNKKSEMSLFDIVSDVNSMSVEI